ncbi:MAG: peptidylprolyl isomerase [Pirellulales bacterium]|nr:peptidylprolyl isomerase [Pirellulales bacterium]
MRAFTQSYGLFLMRLLLLAVFLTMHSTASAVVVRFTSNLGTFDVRMFDSATPLTVANILNYVNDNDFDDSIVHRADTTYIQQPNGSFASSPFVIQGGGWAYPTGGNLTEIPPNAPVLNEPGISNLRGTMALARVSGGINSGTNNWYVNTSNNQFLDMVDDGFTVFGRVTHDGMDVVDTIAEVPTYQMRNHINQFVGTSVPLIGDVTQGITRDNFVLFSSVEVLNIPDGDYDFDGDVDGTDFLIWQRSFGSTTDVAADNNGDAIVNAADLAPWVNNYGTPVLASAVSAVPEPSSLMLLGVSAFSVLCRRSRRRE